MATSVKDRIIIELLKVGYLLNVISIENLDDF